MMTIKGIEDHIVELESDENYIDEQKSGLSNLFWAIFAICGASIGSSGFWTGVLIVCAVIHLLLSVMRASYVSKWSIMIEDWRDLATTKRELEQFLQERGLA